MTRITLNQLNETMEEIQAKLMLIINACSEVNSEKKIPFLITQLIFIFH